jgi:DNA polymerase-4
VFRLTHGSWFEVLGEQPTEALWGIGRRTAAKLAALGIGTVGELAATDPFALAAHFGPATGPWLVQTARGLSPAPVDGAPYVARSHGRETTFQRDIGDWDGVRAEVVRLAREVAADIAAEQRAAGRVVVKVRYVPFFTQTHGHPLAEPTTEAAPIEQAALAALDRFTGRRPVRLLGVRAEFGR